MRTDSYQLDNRYYPRYSVRLNTQVITPEFTIYVNTIEISVEGLRIEAYSQIPPGTEVIVFFIFKKELCFHGKVIWEIAFPEEEFFKYQIGIEVDKITLSGVTVQGFNHRDELIQDILAVFRKGIIKQKSPIYRWSRTTPPSR
jgi:PilZ domain-containing protein